MASKSKKKSTSKKVARKGGKKQQSKFAQLNVPLWAWILLGVVVIATGILLYIRFRPTPSAPGSREPLPAETDVDVAYLMYTNGAIILDIRPANSYRIVSIPNSINIPLEELSDRLDEVPEQGDIIVVDENGSLAGEGRDILLEAGLPRVTAMQGGLEVWILDRNYPFDGTFPR